MLQGAPAEPVGHCAAAVHAVPAAARHHAGDAGGAASLQAARRPALRHLLHLRRRCLLRNRRRR